jgi:hypothetical protein
MYSIRWLLLLCGILFLQNTALADSCVVGATQGAYTLKLCAGDSSSVIENGPLGTETFQIFNHLIFFSELSLALNDHGQWALVTGGGTTDLGTLYGQYTGPITVPPIGIPNVQDNCHSSGVQPGGTLGNYGNLGYDITLRGFTGCFAYPKITGITDQGQVSATVAYVLNEPNVISGSVDYTWNFPEASTVPEPATPMLIISGLLALAALRLKKAA